MTNLRRRPSERWHRTCQAAIHGIPYVLCSCPRNVCAVSVPPAEKILRVPLSVDRVIYTQPKFSFQVHWVECTQYEIPRSCGRSKLCRCPPCVPLESPTANWTNITWQTGVAAAVSWKEKCWHGEAQPFNSISAATAAKKARVCFIPASNQITAQRVNFRWDLCPRTQESAERYYSATLTH